MLPSLPRSQFKCRFRFRFRFRFRLRFRIPAFPYALFRSNTRTLGYVHFGNFGKDEGQLKLKVSLITCSGGGGGNPGGSAIVVKDAVEILQPRAVFCIGSSWGLYRDKTRLGDVVVPAKLTTYAPRRMTSTGAVPCGFTVPLSSSMSRLIRQAGFGWNPPLESRKLEK